MVEHYLAKVGVASSSLVSRSSLPCGGNDDPPAVERIAAGLGRGAARLARLNRLDTFAAVGGGGRSGETVTGWVLAHLEAAGL